MRIFCNICKNISRCKNCIKYGDEYGRYKYIYQNRIVFNINCFICKNNKLCNCCKNLIQDKYKYWLFYL